MAPDRSFDLVVYGATGFTARQLMRYLTSRGQESWAAAARDRAALERVPERPPAVPALTASLDDHASLLKLAERARVVLNLAGPYEPHAEALVAACIEAGTHYADISGEVIFTRGLIDRYHEAARREGVAIVPHSGYESLPFDLLTSELHRRFRAADGSALKAIAITAQFTHTIHPFRVGIGVSGGTVATTLAFARPRGVGRLCDPFALVTEPPAARAANMIDLSARRDPGAGHWLAPLAPAPFVNPAVVHRTNALASDPYASGFTYSEAFDVTATLNGFAAGAGPLARAVSRTVRSIVAISEGRGRARDRLRLKALRWLGPRPGRGPREHQLDGLGYRLVARASSDSGATASMTLNGAGNPGYRSTPNMLAEAGLALARGEFREGGVITPALAYGPKLLANLTRAGIAIDDHVPIRTPAAASALERHGPTAGS
jgi:short subunit dehydrogenase-like uncharacterized protein